MAVEEERDEEVLLVRCDHDGRDLGCGHREGSQEKVQGLRVPLQAHEGHASVIAVQKEVLDDEARCLGVHDVQALELRPHRALRVEVVLREAVELSQEAALEKQWVGWGEGVGRRPRPLDGGPQRRDGDPGPALRHHQLGELSADFGELFRSELDLGRVARKQKLAGGVHEEALLILAQFVTGHSGAEAVGRGGGGGG